MRTVRPLFLKETHYGGDQEGRSHCKRQSQLQECTKKSILRLCEVYYGLFYEGMVRMCDTCRLFRKRIKGREKDGSARNKYKKIKRKGGKRVCWSINRSLVRMTVHALSMLRA